MCEDCAGESSALQRLIHQQDSIQMIKQDVDRGIYEFLDGLTIDQIRVMRNMLNRGDMIESSRANFYDGYVMAMGRCKFGMDVLTGKTPEEAMAELTAPPGAE